MKYLQWEEAYSFEKFLPVLTRWQLLNYKLVNGEEVMGTVFPDRIKKPRNPKGNSNIFHGFKPVEVCSF